MLQAFVDRRGLQILVDMLIDGKTAALQAEAAAALFELASKANATAPQDFTPAVPQPPVSIASPLTTERRFNSRQQGWRDAGLLACACMLPQLCSDRSEQAPT